MPDAAPLILTLALDNAAQTYFDALRRQHFPAHLNYLAAHLTLFHHLPETEADEVLAHLAAVAASQRPLPLQVAAVRSLGRGVAFRLECAGLLALHRQLQTDFAPHLTAQDRQPLQPHVTVQNKVEPPTAQALLAALQHDFAPFGAIGTGLHLWHYRGGPWESLAEFSFTASSAAALSLGTIT